MRISKQCVIFSLLILSICYDELMAEDSPCGDWEPYKDEKCFKIIDETLRNYDDAVKACIQQNSGTLAIIRSKDEQDFLSNLLFKTHKVIDNVWIGAKYTSNKFKWIDDSDLSFTNWASGSPQNETGYDCVQMIPDASSMGKWINEPCGRKNLILCQKLQNWSISLLQKTLLNARKKLNDSLEDVRKMINNQQITINSQQSKINNHETTINSQQATISSQQWTINNLKQSLVPIGFIYVQLPNEKSSAEIWPWMTWKDVTSDYAGLFFRAEGGGSAPFGVLQNENVPSRYIDQVGRDPMKSSESRISLPSSGWSQHVAVAGWSGEINGLMFHVNVNSGEVRPRNKAIRIWKRNG